MREPGKYLIINPGKPGRRELKKAPRRKRKNPSENEALIAQLDFFRERLKNADLSPSGRRLIRQCLTDIGSVLSRDLLR